MSKQSEEMEGLWPSCLEDKWAPDFLTGRLVSVPEFDLNITVDKKSEGSDEFYANTGANTCRERSKVP